METKWTVSGYCGQHDDGIRIVWQIEVAAKTAGEACRIGHEAFMKSAGGMNATPDFVRLEAVKS